MHRHDTLNSITRSQLIATSGPAGRTGTVQPCRRLRPSPTSSAVLVPDPKPCGCYVETWCLVWLATANSRGPRKDMASSGFRYTDASRPSCPFFIAVRAPAQRRPARDRDAKMGTRLRTGRKETWASRRTGSACHETHGKAVTHYSTEEALAPTRPDLLRAVVHMEVLPLPGPGPGPRTPVMRGEDSSRRERIVN